MYFAGRSYSVLKTIWRSQNQSLRLFFKKVKTSSSLNLVFPCKISPVLSVPESIPKPPYVTNNGSYRTIDTIEIKNENQIGHLRQSCQLARKILDYTSSKLEVGITTNDIDIIVHNKCLEENCYPSPLLYRNFPKSVCTSVNNVACHGIPDSRPLQNGDLINIDITVYYNGYHGDLSETYIVGDCDESGHHLVDAARKCRDAGIHACKPGAMISDIGRNISEEAEKENVNIISVFCGHGIGEYFHGLPSIIHDNVMMEAGMSFTVEPVITEGNDEVVILEDGWTAITKDNCRTAQFEHTIVITSTGVEILTL
ncbi:hypothetical protein LOTGIDRAFT_103195 [Lottia gigantea]|uniref:Methionine aminopeptidase n=1 Tax=Lottia gigantea TaxID=225164 RepID=V4AME9_LOTGI|nr:hypothetical protein LOTGIDRAFT_103195 [Lottia gigantea]ESP05334.1 hypothetical protein LOTGIDRAFT_103195 [Lottia gigantea]